MKPQEQSRQDIEREVQEQKSGPDGLQVFLGHLDLEGGCSVRNFGLLSLWEELVANTLLQV
jgi:hypothetical protein